MLLPNRCLATIEGYTYRHALVRVIYKVRQRGGIKCHGTHIEFKKYWFRHSKVDRGDTQTYRQHGDFINLLLFFRSKKSRLNIFFKVVCDIYKPINYIYIYIYICLYSGCYCSLQLLSLAKHKPQAGKLLFFLSLSLSLKLPLS
jgi:hypothetical protein